MPPVLTAYLPILLLAALALVFAVASLSVSSALRPNRPNAVKLSAYECGNDPVRLPGGERFSVKFYVVAMLFIIFDIETIFLFPWAIAFRDLGLFGLGEMVVFIALVFVAYVYVWRKGGLDWSVVTPVEEELGIGVEEEPSLEAVGAR
jgi:NADH-quinone oxidoreductase subunit A